MIVQLLICHLLVEIRDIFKEFEETGNYNYEYNLCVIAGEPLYDILITWFVFEAITLRDVDIIDYLLSLKDLQIDCIDPRYNQTPLTYAINYALDVKYRFTELEFGKTINIIRKLIEHPKMTPDIINTYTDNYNQTALSLAMCLNSFIFKDMYSNYNIAALLLKHGADINLQTPNKNELEYTYRRKPDGCTCALTKVCELKENLFKFRATVDTSPDSLFDRDFSNGMTTLMYAVDGGHYNIVKFIVTRIHELKDKIRIRTEKTRLQPRIGKLGIKLKILLMLLNIQMIILHILLHVKKVIEK